MPDFEDALRAEAHEHALEWEADRARHQEALRRHRERQAHNFEAVEAFMAAMVAAGCPPRRWKVHSRGLDDKRQHHRPKTGWVFRVEEANYFLAANGEVFTVEHVQEGRRRRGTIRQPEPASTSAVLFVEGLATAYRAATNGQEVPPPKRPWLTADGG